MPYDLDDTIAAIGTAPAGAARGMVRITGPQTLACLSTCFSCCDNNLSLTKLKAPVVVPGTICCESPNSQTISGRTLKIPCDLFLWPTDRSYTRQPTAELHTIGSPPLLEAVINEVCAHGARAAEPGEFTLRAFLAGRMDLTQAEAVLGVIDARDQPSLDTALAQLAGGLSQPLTELRESLLQILAELEAGLDFVDEDIEFISHQALHDRLAEAKQTVAATIQQMANRTDTTDLPRVAIIGAPNVGKSSLFNALLASEQQEVRAIVSPQSGTTRDYVTAVIHIEGIPCEIVDTAGQEATLAGESIEQAAQKMTGEQSQQANLRLVCIDGKTEDSIEEIKRMFPADSYLVVRTKADLATDSTSDDQAIACSSVTGAGLDTLRSRIREQLMNALQNDGGTVAITSARCADSLRHADEALSRSLQLVEHLGGDELIAAEVRGALTELGRVVGAVYTDDVLDRIFSQFCIGK